MTTTTMFPVDEQHQRKILGLEASTTDTTPSEGDDEIKRRIVKAFEMAYVKAALLAPTTIRARVFGSINL